MIIFRFCLAHSLSTLPRNQRNSGAIQQSAAQIRSSWTSSTQRTTEHAIFAAMAPCCYKCHCAGLAWPAVTREVNASNGTSRLPLISLLPSRLNMRLAWRPKLLPCDLGGHALTSSCYKKKRGKKEKKIGGDCTWGLQSVCAAAWTGQCAVVSSGRGIFEPLRWTPQDAILRARMRASFPLWSRY